MQIALLVFAPAWTTAGIYVILFRMIPIVGERSSPISAKTCLFVCLGIDITSLVLQAVGGGLAGQAFSSDVDTKPGTYTIVAGILFQLVATFIYTGLMSIVFFRASKPILASKPLRWLAFATTLTVCCMIARNVFRSVELLEGWTGHLQTTQGYMIGLDGSLMLLAVIVLNIAHPGRLLKNAVREKEERLPKLERMGSDDEARDEGKVSDAV
ncbi:putative Sphingoid long-chain base transporter RSB1 [Glarea lozoyensis 74030]|nr:putative Sphingoid long-chain base transporter RSB1 [Glarea lozoyensis 74030]